MPAGVSSLIPAVLDRVPLVQDVPEAGVSSPEQVADLREYRAGVPDPRKRRAVRHTLISIVLITAAAVTSGAPLRHRDRRMGP